MLGFVLELADATVTLTTTGVTVLASLGMLIAIGSSVAGLLRSVYPDDGQAL